MSATPNPAAVDAGEEPRLMYEPRGMFPSSPSTSRDRGQGPFRRLILRGATVIDGTGAPPWGPVDIVVEGDRIAAIVSVGTPGKPINPSRRPAAGDFEIDCHGRFVTPGLIDAHGHVGTPWHAMSGEPLPADYVYKLWLAHGVTTVREMGSMNGLSWMLEQRDAQRAQRIAAPNFVLHSYFPAVNERIKTIHTVEQARQWVRRLRERGADGIKFFGAPPRIMQAALEEARAQGLRTGCHHAQLGVTRVNAIDSARWGLNSTEHYYGIPEALYDRRVIQDYPAGYDYNDEYFRFAVSGEMFSQAAQPGSTRWNEVLDEFLELGHSFVPTFNIYDANRDLMRTRRADWHGPYTMRTLWRYFQPQRGGHGAYWYRWSTKNEIDWKRNYQVWMQFANEYKNRGGRVCTGSDSGFIFQVYGFGLIRELELLQEAGFNPLEALRSATHLCAELLGVEEDTGSIDVGKRADLLVHDRNPLDDFKLLYATGAWRLDDRTGQAQWERCLQQTICAGMVYQVDELLADVRALVDRSWEGHADERPPGP